MWHPHNVAPFNLLVILTTGRACAAKFLPVEAVLLAQTRFSDFISLAHGRHAAPQMFSACTGSADRAPTRPNALWKSISVRVRRPVVVVPTAPRGAEILRHRHTE